ncbi:MAG: aldo/keto reductase [Chthonomonas sp.]|nr:aldo/keto reductase [Chthonomonas sp.]
MKYRPLGKSGLEVSEISFGCWTMGGLNWVNGTPNGWANVDEDEVTRAVKIALDAGVNHFDNADVYGNGRAEQMLRRVLDRLGVRSTDLVIATKIGHFPGTAAHAYEPAHIRHQCEQSLINLGREHIDLYYFHHGSFGDHLEEAAATMLDLVAEGKVRFIGQSAYSVEDFARAIPVVKPVVLQSRAHALADDFIKVGSPLQALMDEHELSFVAFSPLAQGLLLDKFDPKNPPAFEEGDYRKGRADFEPANFERLKPKLAKLKERFGDTVEDLAAVALQYVLAHPNVCCAIPGFRNERQAACNVAGGNRVLSKEDVEFVRATLS